MPDIHQRIVAAIDALAAELLEFSHAIHANPEPSFKERFACTLLRDTLSRHGLAVTTGVYGLETSLESAFSRAPGPTVALLAEYDALPGLGHACGHNVIATASLGAMLGLHAVAEQLHGYREAHRHAGRGNGRRQGTDGTRRGFRRASTPR